MTFAPIETYLQRPKPTIIHKIPQQFAKRHTQMHKNVFVLCKIKRNSIISNVHRGRGGLPNGIHKCIK